MDPAPLHTVQVSREKGCTPVPVQKWHFVTGSDTKVFPLPPHTWHVANFDKIKNGSFPVPLQNAQETLLMVSVQGQLIN